MKSLVICDLDKTLLKVNTSFYFGKYLWEKGELSHAKTLLLILHYLSHSLGITSMHHVHQKSFALLFKGKPIHLFNTLAHIFAKELIAKKTEKAVLDFIQEKKKQGAHLFLLSSGPDFLVKQFGALFGFDDALGTSYLEDHKGNFFTIGDVIDGSQKKHVARKWIQQKNWEKSYALTDSILDLELLNIVTDPIVVNPDFRLKQEALARGFLMIKT